MANSGGGDNNNSAAAGAAAAGGEQAAAAADVAKDGNEQRPAEKVEETKDEPPAQADLATPTEDRHEDEDDDDEEDEEDEDEHGDDDAASVDDAGALDDVESGPGRNADPERPAETPLRRDDLWSKLLTVNGRQYFFDVRENTRGRYLKLTEVGPFRPRSTVLITPRLFTSLRSLLQSAIQGSFDHKEATEEAHHVVASRYDDAGAKKYYLDVVHNPKRGRYVKIVEAQASRGRAVVILPEASWLQAKRLFDQLISSNPEFGGASTVIKLAPPPDPSSTPVQPPKKAPAKSLQTVIPTPPPQSSVEDASEDVSMKPAQTTARKAETSAAAMTNGSPDQNGGGVRKTVIASRIIRVEYRCRFYLDLLENSYGRTLKIAQLKSNHRRETVMLPEDLLPALAALLEAIEAGDEDPQVSALETMAAPQFPATPASASPRQQTDADARRPQPILGRSFKSRNRKLFFLDLMQGPRGRFLRIAESSQQRAHQRRTSVAFPDDCLEALHLVVDEFVALTPALHES